MNLTPFKDAKNLNYPTATVASLFWGRAAQEPRSLAAWEQTELGWKPVNWQERADEVARLALGLKKWGIGRGDRVALYLPTSLTWENLDYAIASLGAVSVSLYDLQTP